ncbi:MAG: DUF2889 domain-containing protein [Novosphingobium sp.]
MTAGEPEDGPHFRRRFVVTPGPGRVTAALEDDYHCMAVVLDHDGVTITGVEAVMERWPWTTCPGATAVAATTFTGVALSEAARRGDKTANCTHLYDLALLAAAHALDERATVFDAYISDRADGVSRAKLCRNGEPVLNWTVKSGEIVAPAEIAGTGVLMLRPWIAALAPAEREVARLLQWATIMAGGRSTPMAEQSEAALMPPNCYTYQPARAKVADRVGRVYDFSRDRDQPLAHFDGTAFASRRQAPPLVWPL